MAEKSRESRKALGVGQREAEITDVFMRRLHRYNLFYIRQNNQSST